MTPEKAMDSPARRRLTANLDGLEVRIDIKVTSDAPKGEGTPCVPYFSLRVSSYNGQAYLRVGYGCTARGITLDEGFEPEKFGFSNQQDLARAVTEILTGQGLADKRNLPPQPRQDYYSRTTQLLEVIGMLIEPSYQR